MARPEPCIEVMKKGDEGLKDQRMTARKKTKRVSARQQIQDIYSDVPQISNCNRVELTRNGLRTKQS